jgi:DNA-directed RNA polymerase specialized sigma24 family protein
MHDHDLFDALTALRAAPRVEARELAPCWRVVWAALVRFGRSVGSGMVADREEAVAEALVKVQRRVRDLQAADAAGAQAWLATLYRRTYLDIVRRRRRRREIYDDPSPDGAREGLIERLEAPDPSIDPAKLDSVELAPFEDALFDRVDEHVAFHVRAMARPNAHRRAVLAYDSIVRRRPTEALMPSMGQDVHPDTFYQWVRRGREGVLIPVLEQWLAETPADDPEHRFAAELLDILQSRQRSDAGQPRPKRRKGNGEDPS